MKKVIAIYYLTIQTFFPQNCEIWFFFFLKLQLPFFIFYSVAATSFHNMAVKFRCPTKATASMTCFNHPLFQWYLSICRWEYMSWHPTKPLESNLRRIINSYLNPGKTLYWWWFLPLWVSMQIKTQLDQLFSLCWLSSVFAWWTKSKQSC